MTDDKNYLPLGKNHFYYMDSDCEIDYDFYLSWVPELRADVKVKKFGSKWGGEPTPIDLIRHKSGIKTFQACRRAWPEPASNGFVFIDSSYKVTELIDELAQMMRGKKFLYNIQIYANKKDHNAFVIYPPWLDEDEDFQNFATYINLTR